MNPLNVLVVAIAGGCGASLRYALDSILSSRWGRRFPVGIFVVNLSGSFALGLLLGLALDEGLLAALGAGLLGGYTTLSTTSVDTFRLLSERRFGAAALNGLGMLAAAVALAIAGILLGRVVAGS